MFDPTCYGLWLPSKLELEATEDPPPQFWFQQLIVHLCLILCTELCQGVLSPTNTPLCHVAARVQLNAAQHQGSTLPMTPWPYSW